MARGKRSRRNNNLNKAVHLVMKLDALICKDLNVKTKYLREKWGLNRLENERAQKAFAEAFYPTTNPKGFKVQRKRLAKLERKLIKLGFIAKFPLFAECE